MISLTATGWELLSNFLCIYCHRAKWDIHEEVEAGAGLYGVNGRDCRGHIGGVRVEATETTPLWHCLRYEHRGEVDHRKEAVGATRLLSYPPITR